jgi:heterodisulfide reductase subunit B
MDRHLRARYRVPILFFTQLMGLAFGIEPKALGIGTEVVSPAAALARIGVELPPPEETAVPAGGPHEPKRQKRPQGLPMPQPLEGRQ